MFTGAEKDKVGYLGKAEGGTLFLDEIGDLSLEIQGKLLRILQEGEFSPVGETRSIRSNIRFVAATNQDLEKRVGYPNENSGKICSTGCSSPTSPSLPFAIDALI
jgi:transcriptional regulator with GAF, ATPase, and Fis domain